jgi:cation diffusion facilitator family transporter
LHTHNLERWQHTHRFAVVDSSSERRTAIVVGLTAVTMVVEVAAGMFYGSMALLADGWHMGTHVAALAISVVAYRHARLHANDRHFTFGTGKVGVLGGFASAVALAVVALLMAATSVERFFRPITIQFDQAILVAAVGLTVNLASALVLRGSHEHGGASHGDHDHSGHEHTGHSHAHDHNLRAAYLHVVADALTSVLAIVALLAGKLAGYVWMDPVMGLVGGALIAWWSYGLVRDTSHILVDRVSDPDLLAAVRSAIETGSDDRVSDLHIWRVGPDKFAAIVSIVTHRPLPPEHYKGLLVCLEDLAHVTMEVHLCPDSPAGSSPQAR